MPYFEGSKHSLMHFETNSLQSSCPTIVLVHGAGDCGASWSLVLSKVRNAIAVDLPGHGSSTGTSPCSIGDYADSVIALVRSLHQSQQASSFLLAGHSMGGLVAQIIYRKAPALIRAVALLSTGSKLRVSSRLLTYLATLSHATTHEQFLQHFQLTFSPKAPAHLVDAYARLCRTTTLGIAHNDFVAISTADLTADLSGIQVPVLVLVGADDVMTPKMLSEQLVAKLSRAESLCVLPDVGHSIQLEAPDRVAEELQSFRERLIV
eukprot:TRINITY_DN12638_c0_g1_i1.p1 TRINITY_DN12638_c0_g1~~TRINITY_DN12638_c0_g1_i1.p1  ORF type:complete len:264 (-),score=43.12 TRINITY_DN12638_c0_g1_i1:49-840(-)